MKPEHSNTSFDKCIKCSVCNLYCPVYLVTDRYPGPKHSGPDAERIRMKHLLPPDPSLDFCTNCKRCEIACPSGVAITDMIVRAKLGAGQHKNYLRDFILSHTDLTGSLSSAFSPLVNTMLQLQPVKSLMETVLGIDARRTLPAYASSLKTRPAKNPAVIYYRGCYNKYNDHAVAAAVTAVLQFAGIEAGSVDEKCCGVPLIANNFKDKACSNGEHNIRVLAATGNLPVLVSSPSCLLTLRDEYENVLALDNSAIKPRLQFITAFLNDHWQKFAGKMQPMNLKVAYHAPCHLERIGYAADTIQFLKNISGLEVHVLNSECCGISGTYGFKKEHYEIAQKVGQRLFEQIAAVDPDLVVTDCETCKMQIEMSTRYKVIHPVEILQKSLGV